MLCNPHHITAHDDRQFIMWAFFIDIKLDIGKVDYMQLDRSCIFGNLLCKIHYLLFGPLAGVRRCMEIGCLQSDATFGDHITCNRTVDSTGKQKHRGSVGSDRHSTRSRNDLRIDIDLFSDFYVKQYIRMMDVYTDLRECIQDGFPKVIVDLHRFLWIGFFCTAGFHFKCDVLIRIYFIHICDHIFFQFFKSFILYADNRADPDDSEYSLQSFYYFVPIIISVTVHINSSLCFISMEQSVQIL